MRGIYLHRAVLLVLLVACAKPASAPPAAVLIVPPPEPEQNGPVVARAIDPHPAPVPSVDGPEAWLQRWGPMQCASFDYHPNGGLQNVWCHRPAELALQTLADVAKVPVFVSGPHSSAALVLDAPSEFGHYNPAFVQYLIEHGVSARGSALQRATQPSYDANVKVLGRVLAATRDKIKSSGACFEREKASYVAAMKAKKRGYYERWFFFMNPAFCDQTPHADTWYFGHGMDGGVDGNVTKSAVGFWLRRSLDGTFDAFSSGLDRLRATYDPP